MVLSRFWLIIFISSILFVVTGVFTSRNYSIDFVLNGKKENPILIGEKYMRQLPSTLRDSLRKSSEGKVIVNLNDRDPDTTYVFKNKTVQVYSGVQKSDGLLETCKVSLTDLILPLMAYLAFFCGIKS